MLDPECTSVSETGKDTGVTEHSQVVSLVLTPVYENCTGRLTNSAVPLFSFWLRQFPCAICLLVVRSLTVMSRFVK